MATTPKPSTTERNAALGRLARNEAVGLTDRRQAADYGEVEELAVQRLVTQNLSNATTADMAYGGIIKLLEDARLTISLRAPNWFYWENKSKTYGNFWERGVSGASSDESRRDKAENSMFGYSTQVLENDDKVVAAQNRLMTLGTRPSTSFQPAMRPRYAAVDFAFCVNGGLSKYGRSFLVLKDYLKHNATYTHCDSFEVDMDLATRKAEYSDIAFTLGEVGCSYFQFGYIVLFCHPAMLKKLHSYAMGLTEQHSEENILGGNIYIEAQLHADIKFSQDVADLCISARDCASGPVPHPKYGRRFGSKTVWDNQDVVQVKDNARKFAKANGIKYVDVP